MRRSEYVNITVDQPAVAVISCSVSKAGGGRRNRTQFLIDNKANFVHKQTWLVAHDFRSRRAVGTSAGRLFEQSGIRTI